MDTNTTSRETRIKELFLYSTGTLKQLAGVKTFGDRFEIIKLILKKEGL